MTRCLKENAECDVCNKVFKNNKSMTNHRRWHKIPKYLKFQQKCIVKCQNIKITTEQRAKLSLTKLGKNNPMWKGDDIGYQGIHARVKLYKIKPLRCEDCNEIKPLDLANISQEYKLDLDDWEWICRKCHMIKDGRMDKLVERNMEMK